MSRFDLVRLIAVRYERDDLKQFRAVGETARTVMCDIQSTTQSEFYAAGQAGFEAAYRVVLESYLDYEGEEIAEVAGVRYRIYRTFRRGTGNLELYLKREEGARNGSNH